MGFGNCKECQFEPSNGHAQNCSKRPSNPICQKCGREMEEAYDSIAKGYTGYLWKCKCSPKLRLSIG